METTDEQLMSLVKAGQLDYLNELFSRYSKRIYNYFLKSTLERADSDDLTQELFIRVMKYRNSYKEGHSVQFWIFQIARNMIKDHFRKMKIHKDQFNPVEVIPEREDVGDDELFEREKKLHRAMKELSDEKRELLVLSKFQGMKYEQIAKMRDTTVSNIKVQVHRTIKELKEAYFQLEEV
ncbi:sigma-70 family RNA polymerase sigma factor [Ekhidna sp.]|uniref:RNA polymerase sigma factor n=1 Tax=Ekhidna sp. TaxID=2608089 RepID=UPI0032EBE0B5